MYWIIAGLLLLALWRIVCVMSKKPQQKVDYTFDDERNMRHTIRVNLSILDAELDELTKRFKASGQFAEKEAVGAYLSKAREVSISVDLVVSHAAYPELTKLLGEVFGAMNGTHEARTLLDKHVPKEAPQA